MTIGNGSSNGSVLSVEQIEQMLSQIATTGSGAQQVRALQLLQRARVAVPTIELPPPASDSQVIEWLGRMLASVGPMLGRLANQRAYGTRQPAGARLKASLEQLPLETREQIKRITSLPTLYKLIPELKRPGRPLGYPAAGGPLQKRAFAQRLATQFYVERLNGEAAPSDVTTDPDSRYRAALEDLRAVIRIGGPGGAWLNGTRDVIEPLLAAIDALLEDPSAAYPPAPKVNGADSPEPAPPGPA